MYSKHVLVVEDDEILGRSVQWSLEQEGYHVSRVATGRSAVDSVRRRLPDLILLDVGLPDGDGFEVGREILREHDVPVIFVTGRSSELDRVTGLMLGGVDYITKPFGLVELMARVHVQLRRRHRERLQFPDEKITLAGIHLDLVSHTVTARGKPVELPLKEFALLVLLMTGAGRAISTAKILTTVWGPDYLGAPDLIYAHVSWLRQRIEVDPRHPRLVRTVRGVGYRFDPGGSDVLSEVRSEDQTGSDA